jgi:hypothetical protein
VHSKNSGGGATTDAEFFDSVDITMKKFLVTRTDTRAQGLRNLFQLIQTYQAEFIKTATEADKNFLANESNTVQPIWSKFLSEDGLLLNDKRVLKFSDIKTLKSKRLTLRWEDRHLTTSIATRKPDEVMYIAGHPSTVYYIAVVGDLKSPGQDFTTANKGHILSFLVRLMECQPFRHFAFGYLRNSEVVQFFKVTRGNEGFTYLQTPEYNWCLEGADIFADLLTAQPSELGWCVPELPFESMHTTAFLGSGMSCSVYATSNNTVVKIFRRNQELDVELLNLKIVGSVIAIKTFVPRVVRHSGDFLEVTPIGRHYTDDLVQASAEDEQRDDADLPRRAVFGLKHILQLIFVISQSPLVHRDLHLNNMYITEEGNLLLNDWALAVQPNTTVAFAGVDDYVSSDVLGAKDGGRYEALRKDDLHAIVRIAYRIVHARDFERIVKEKPLAFWKARLGSGQWKVAEAAAAANNTDALGEAMEKVMPW